MSDQQRGRTSHVVLNLSDDEANILASELTGIEEDLRELGDEERLEAITNILNKLHRSKQ